jgi:hypothetical protein
VTFQSGADNLVPGDTNHAVDVFLRDRRTGRTELISVPSGGGVANLESGEFQPSAITPDGRYVAFSSFANLTRTTGTGSPTSFCATATAKMMVVTYAGPRCTSVP